MRGYIIGRIASLCSRFIVSHWSIKLSKLSYWLPDLSGLRWMTSSDPDWIVTRGCWWRVQLRSRHQTLLSALADVNSSNNTERVCYLRNLASEHSKFGQQKINSWSQDSRLTWIEWIDIKYFRKNVPYIYYSFNHQHGQTGAQVYIYSYSKLNGFTHRVILFLSCSSLITERLVWSRFLTRASHVTWVASRASACSRACRTAVTSRCGHCSSNCSGMGWDRTQNTFHNWSEQSHSQRFSLSFSSLASKLWSPKIMYSPKYMSLTCWLEAFYMFK